MASMESCQFNMADLAPSQNFLAPCQVGHFDLAPCQEILAICQVSILLGTVPKSGFCFFRIPRHLGNTLRDIWRSSDRWFFR
ncbi:hypothetical protein [Cynomolgus macaque cytomegalovirus strain Mauritius]|uniref:Uncharacterized protein n=1 Tax=Cynomolgus macaque cytomegalovirus strain Mauritius TaxID=1690255 RepID=A0A0K1H0C8_9BETA|nr:hypothetical protein [Cynomolgus macaque cytomegalovirus strain Mauritius]